MYNNGIFHGKAFQYWLLDAPWSETKLHAYELMNIVPGLHQYMDYLLDLRSDEEYLNRNGMDYSDIHDPRKLKQTNSGSNLARFGVNFISKNVESLYK